MLYVRSLFMFKYNLNLLATFRCKVYSRLRSSGKVASRGILVEVGSNRIEGI